MTPRELADTRRALLGTPDGERLLRELELRSAGVIRDDLLPRYELFDRTVTIVRAAFPDRDSLPPGIALAIWPNGMCDGTIRVDGVRHAGLPDTEPDVVPTLTVLSGRNIGMTFLLARTPLVIGRGGSSDLVLSENSLSRMQARFERDAQGRTFMQDLGSTAGSWSGTERSQGPLLLEDGARLRLNALLLRFRDARVGGT